MKIQQLVSLYLILSMGVLSTACTESKTESATKPAETPSAEVKPAAESSEPSSPQASSNNTAIEFTKTDVKVGEGAEAKSGQTVSVHYTGWLYDPAATDTHGKKFDSSRDRGSPFDFPLGASRVIKGWDQGVVGMKVGGQRTLLIPSDMAYGSRGAGGAIPPNATLIFDVELLGIK